MTSGTYDFSPQFAQLEIGSSCAPVAQICQALCRNPLKRLTKFLQCLTFSSCAANPDFAFKNNQLSLRNCAPYSPNRGRHWRSGPNGAAQWSNLSSCALSKTGKLAGKKKGGCRLTPTLLITRIVLATRTGEINGTIWK